MNSQKSGDQFAVGTDFRVEPMRATLEVRRNLEPLRHGELHLIERQEH